MSLIFLFLRVTITKIINTYPINRRGAENLGFLLLVFSIC